MGLKDFQDSSGARVCDWRALFHIPLGGIFAPFPIFCSVIPAKAGIQEFAAFRRFCQNQDSQDWGIFRIAFLAITENPANPNTGNRWIFEDERAVRILTILLSCES